ncbi:MAG: PKD domain-containing protein [archaeon]
MKKIFSLLTLSLMLLSLGVVSAVNNLEDVNFVSPADGDYVSDEVIVEWANGNYATSNLMYKLGICSDSLQGTILQSGIVSEGEYTWEVSDLEDGNYCLKIADGSNLHNEVTVIIDKTAPTITFTGNLPYFIVKDTPITISATLTDNKFIDKYKISFGDGSEEEAVDISDVQLYLLSKEHTYNISGQYIIAIKLIDIAGNVAAKTEIVTVNSAEPDWIIPLYADETNMFSIPLIPTSTAIGSVLPKSVSDNANTIWSYQKGEWKYNTPTSTGWSTTSTRLQNIVPGYGYIIFMNNNAVVYGSGKQLGQDLPPEVTLTTGWNLIGHYGLNDNIEVDSAGDNAFSSLELGDNYYWNNLLTVNEDGEFESMNNLDSKRAYWLSIKGINLNTDTEKKYFKYQPSQECYSL